MTNFSIHLIDTNEPSNICFDLGDEKILHFVKTDKAKYLYQNKLLILCSEDIEKIQPNEYSWQSENGLTKCKDNHSSGWMMINGKLNNFKRVIATNSPTITPNCYISEDRVKEFVEYWNKWKELPKFDIGTKTSYSYERLGNHIQIKWLPKEESKGFDHCLNCGDPNHSGLDCPQFKESLKKAIEKQESKQLEQELEEAANDFYKRNAAFSEEMDNSLNRDIELQQEAFKKGANHPIAKKIHQQESVELIKELLKEHSQLIYMVYGSTDDAIITKAENFLKSK